jgi:hypothetical protein
VGTWSCSSRNSLLVPCCHAKGPTVSASWVILLHHSRLHDTASSGSDSTWPQVKYNPSWEADSRSVSKEIPRLLRNTNVLWSHPNSPPLDPISSQMNPVRTTSRLLSSRPILTFYSHLSQVFRMASSLQAFQPKFCLHFSSSHATYTSSPNFLS